MTNTPVTDPALVAKCGLYCATCRSYLKGKCPGCAKNDKASWCGVRKCCNESGIASCAQCSKYENPNDCKQFNNIISKLFGLIFRSDRAACIQQIKAIGLEGHAEFMAKHHIQTIKKS